MGLGGPVGVSIGSYSFIVVVYLSTNSSYSLIVVVVSGSMGLNGLMLVVISGPAVGLRVGILVVVSGF